MMDIKLFLLFFIALCVFESFMFMLLSSHVKRMENLMVSMLSIIRDDLNRLSSNFDEFYGIWSDMEDN